MKEELICNCLVVGMRIDVWLERLQLEPHLSLDKAKQLIHQRESIQMHQDIIQKMHKRKTICWMQ